MDKISQAKRQYSKKLEFHERQFFNTLIMLVLCLKSKKIMASCQMAPGIRFWLFRYIVVDK